MRRTVRIAVLAALLVAVVPAGAGAAGVAGTAAAVQAGPAVLADFNGDGIDDLVVGVPGEDLGGAADAGVVDVIYGSESGLADGTREQLTQAVPEPGDGFGAAVATGDFNGDIFTDLAVGVPGENVGAIADAGAVEVFYGAGGGGLPSVGDQLLRQGAAGMAGTAEAGDRFGAALASGLVNDGDEAELAVGAPGEDVGATAGAGAVSLVEGGPGGLLGSDNVLITERQPETGDGFGAAVEIGDLSGGGDPSEPDDLAVGAPGENVGTAVDAGAVSVLDSADDGSGLPAGAVQDRYFQGNGGVPGASESGDLFGYALAAGQFGSGGVDLAVGVPGENVGAAADAGAVVALAGPTTHQLLLQGGATTIGSLPGATEAGDQFGSALGAADVDGNNADNLVVGVPGENLGAVADAGAVLSICGFDGQFEGCADGVLTQGNPEAGDAFGAALAPGNFDGNEFPDLAVGAPGETVAGRAAAGAADARDGGAGGLPADPDEPLYFQGNDGVPGTAETGDLFAASVAA
jgi:FG-GAP repeat